MIGVLDWETSMKPILHPWQEGAFPVACGLMTEGGRYQDWWFKHDEVQTEDDPKSISDALQQVSLLVGHNLKFDLNWLTYMGVEYEGKYWCTQTSEYLLGGQQLWGLNLKEVAIRRGQPEKLDIVQGYWDRGIDTNHIPKHILAKYLKQDCDTTMHVYLDQLQELNVEKPHLRPTMTIHNNTTPLLNDIECNGMPVDVPMLHTMGANYKAMLDEMDFNLRDLLKLPDLNLQSKDELSASLYGGTIHRDGTEIVTKERWATKKVPFKFTYADGSTTMKTRNERYREQYPMERKCVVSTILKGAGFETDKSMAVKKEGYFKTGIEVIKNLKAGTAVRREIKKELIQRAKVSKLVSSVLGSEPGKGYVNKVQADGRMHPQYNQSRTGTGRYSSQDPNGQNFSRSKEDQEGFTNPLKRVFVPSAPTNVTGDARGLIAAGDLAQLEWRVAAFLSQDPIAMNEIIAGIDAHADNAVRFFGDIKFRQDAKIMTFRLLYGGTAFSFFMDPLMPNFSKKKWMKIVDDYYRKYFVLAQWQAANIQLVNHNGGWYVSQFGRVFNFPLSMIKRGGSVYEGYKPTQIKNYEVQGTATGDIVPFAMYVVRQRMGGDFPFTKWIGQIHDAILFDTIVGEIKRLSDLVIQAFEDLPGLIEKMWGIPFNVPLTGDMQFGLNYGDLIHKASRPTIGAATEFKYGKAA